MDNGKKEFAENGMEEDILSSKTRRYFVFGAGLPKSVKRTVNKRFRKRGKQELKDL